MSDASGSKRSGLFSALKDGVKQFNTTIQEGGSLQHTLRQGVTTLQSPADTLKINLAIKAGSAVVSDYEALSRETTTYSKHLFLWGQEAQGNDLKDVSDRLAWIEFETAKLFKEHARRVDQARSALKDVRNFENELVPKRKNKAALQAKLATTKSSSELKRITSEIDQLDSELAPADNTLESLKRTKLHESFSLQLQAQRELGEKLSILAGYGELLLRTLESDGFGSQYTGQEKTARIKGQATEALQGWTLPNADIPTPTLREGGESYLGRADTQSFASTHGSEFSHVSDGHSHQGSLHHSSSAHGVTPPPSHPGGHSLHPIPIAGAVASRPSPPPVPARHPSHDNGGVPAHTYGSSPGGTHLNLSPTPHDLGPSYSPRQQAYPVEPIESTSPSMPAGPTVAETGAPIVGTGGPISGQLPNRKASLSSPSGVGASSSTSASAAQYQSAAQEKALLEQAQVERERTQLAGATALGSSSGPVAGSSMTTTMTQADDLPPSYTDGLPQSEMDARARAEAEQILAAERERKQAPL
ncbi:hypothetical protein ACM66B_002107 [Microbotryomycetes sp. NB124-2]